MPTPTYTPLANVTLGTTASSVTFSSIPATYRDLILVSSVKFNTGGSNGTLEFRLNGDSGSNYSYVFMQGTSSGAQSGAGTITVGVAGQGENSSGSSFSSSSAQFMDYSATDKHKTVLARGDSPSTATQAWATRWANTSAITSILLTNSQGYAIGSTFNLFGVIA
jgi:hypothetical protein